MDRIARGIDFGPFTTERTRDFTGREWVFEAIDQWLGRKDSPRYFLLTGEPGSGKTAVAVRLAQFSDGQASPPPGCAHLGPGFLRAVHFCRATASDWLDPRTFARSISLQLAAIPAFAMALKDVGDEKITVQLMVDTVAPGGIVTGMIVKNLVITNLHGQEAFNRIVLDPLRSIYNDGYDQPIFILVDSLDEALASATDGNIVDLLAGAQGLDGRVRFILTSRSEPRVENRFLSASGMSLSDPSHAGDYNRDIAGFVAERLAHDEELTKACCPSGEPNMRWPRRRAERRRIVRLRQGRHSSRRWIAVRRSGVYSRQYRKSRAGGIEESSLCDGASSEAGERHQTCGSVPVEINVAVARLDGCEGKVARV